MRRPYQKPVGGQPVSALRKEWVSLEDGDVCAWELTTPQMLQLAEASARPAVDPRGGVSDSAATAWLISLSTHHGDEADSPRVWDDMHRHEALALRWTDTQQLIAAIRRVCGTDEAGVAALTDFTGATEAPKPSGSRSSASSTSTGCRRKSTSPITS